MPNSYALVSLSAGQARAHSNGVAWTPKPEEPHLPEFAAKSNKYHGEIIGPIANSDIRNLASLAEVIWVRTEMDLGPMKGQSPDMG